MTKFQAQMKVKHPAILTELVDFNTDFIYKNCLLLCTLQSFKICKLYTETSCIILNFKGKDYFIFSFFVISKTI